MSNIYDIAENDSMNQQSFYANGHEDGEPIQPKRYALQNFPTGNTDLMCAAANGDSELVARYLDDPDSGVNLKNSDGSSALRFAANFGYLDIVRMLCDKGATVDASCKWGTPLMSACRGGYLFVAEFLIYRGADVTTKIRGDISVVYAAISNGVCGIGDGMKLEIVKLLVASGADINTRCFCGSTPLHAAIRIDNIHVVGFLVREGADINTMSRDGTTPLHDAIFSDNVSIVSLLIRRGVRDLPTPQKVMEIQCSGKYTAEESRMSYIADIIQRETHRRNKSVSLKDNDPTFAEPEESLVPDGYLRAFHIDYDPTSDDSDHAE